MSLNNINVSTWDNPIADFEISTFNTGVLENIYFSDYSTSESPIINWSWDFGDNNNSNYQNPSHMYDNEGQYTICLTIEDENNCISETCQIVNIYTQSYAYIPDIFTINNDNINDVFKPIITGIIVESYEFNIYDRWGKLLFSTTNYLDGWDGTHKGNIVEQDIYSYKVNYTTTSNNKKEYIGKVTLVK